MPGLTGRQGAAAYAKTSTWGTAASVTKQIHIRATDGLDAEPQLIDDAVFNQDYLGDAQVGDENPRIQDLAMTLRYEDTDEWVAAVIGSPAAPTVVSSVAAGSLVAQSHVIELATNPAHYFTLATAYGESDAHYVQEVTSLRPRSFMVRTGDGGVMDVSVGMIGNKTIYDSAINTNSTVYGATAANIANRVFRKQGVFRMNAQGDGALAAADAVSSMTGEIEFGMTRPAAEGDFVYGQDYISAPDDDGVAEFPVNVTFVAANTVSLNSITGFLKAAGNIKGDLTFTGTYINSDTQRSMLFEWPNLQVMNFSAPIQGHGKIRAQVGMRAKLATTSPTGMAFVNPMRLTWVNANSNTMLS